MSSHKPTGRHANRPDVTIFTFQPNDHSEGITVGARGSLGVVAGGAEFSYHTQQPRLRREQRGLQIPPLSVIGVIVRVVGGRPIGPYRGGVNNALGILCLGV